MRIGDKLYFSPTDKFIDLDFIQVDKVKLLSAFRNRVEGFYFEPAENLITSAEFAAGVLCVTSIDFLARISLGLDSVGSRFKTWLNENIPNFDHQTDDGKTDRANRFYDHFRNGLVHEGRIKNGSQFCKANDQDITEFQDDNGILIINPMWLLEKIKEAFNNYINNVKNDRLTYEKFRCALIRDFYKDYEIAQTL